MIRPATPDDLPAITALQRRWDEHWFGVAEHDAAEMAELFERVPATQTAVCFDGETLTGAALWSGRENFVSALTAPAHAELVDWFVAQPGQQIDVLERDRELRTLFDAHGWHHEHSAFELLRSLTPDWTLDAPLWPGGVEVRALQPEDAPAIHRLIYRDAAWAEVPGHPYRDYDDWYGIFAPDLAVADQQVLVWADDRPVGVATGRTWSDGTGWVAQLAVARAYRGRGLGRALLLEAFRRRAAGGATALGLSVQATNEHALALYVGVGLRVDREWLNYRRC